MRSFSLIVVTVVASLASGCQCSPATPTSVTIRVKNASRDAIFVDDTDRALGVAVQRNVGGSWFSFTESPCSCVSCDLACSSSACDVCTDAGVSFIQKLEPEMALTRTWSGVVHVSSYACGRNCLSNENAPLDETFNAHLCYANQITGFDAPDGGREEGPFPNVGVTCVDKQFKISDGVVEVGPARGADCTTTADCRGLDELCFAGSCTAGCPANGYPNAPGLQVASITDRGFFTTMPVNGRSVSTGTGAITSAQYGGTTLTVQLSRRGAANELLTGAVQVTLPSHDGPAFSVNQNVTVTVTDASTDDNVNNRALVIRDAATNKLLFAADVGQLGRVLTNADLAPLTVTDGTTVTGCRTDGCGKALFVAARVSAQGTAGTVTVDVETGDIASITTAQGTYRFANAYDAKYAKTSCKYNELRPYAVWLQP